MTAPGGAPRPPSLLRSVVPITLFVLLAGIVGPIFLVMGLVLRDQPETGWMLPLGIGITALDLVIGVLVGRARHRSAQRRYRLQLRGRRASAQVLSIEQTSVRINDQPVLVLNLRIHGADLESFEATARQAVPEYRIPLLHAGELPALVDPETGEWEIDWDRAPSVASRYAAPAAPVAASATPADSRPRADRLAELDDLLRRDLVTREEYDATRARIIAEL